MQQSENYTLIETYIKEPFQETMKGFVIPSIRLKTIAKRPIEKGRSRLGGVPDLPGGTSWPTANSTGKPYLFLAQINLAEIKPFDSNKELPPKGMLYFFYDVENWHNGKVIYTAESDHLLPAELPNVFKVEEKPKSFWKRWFGRANPYRIFEACELEIFIDYYIPGEESLQVNLMKQKLGYTNRTSIFKEKLDNADEYADREPENISNHHLLGHYNGIQGEFLQLEFLEPTPSIQKLNEDQINSALEWKLLLQIDSDKNTGMQWADWGRIYFFIHQNDLANKDFSKVRIAFDCY